MGLIDAVWSAAAGGAVVLAGWRWADYRSLAAQPVPTATDTAVIADQAREVLSRLRRHSARRRLRHTDVGPGWRRLDRATDVLAGLPMRTGGPAETVTLEAAAAESALRDLARRAAGLQRALPYDASHRSLGQTHDALVAEFEHGVTAYEELVGAAAAYLAEEERTASQQPSLNHLTETTELLRGIAEGFVELRPASRPTG